MLYVWRRKMHASYKELCETPIEVIMQDLATIDIEITVEQSAKRRLHGPDKH
jgi:hypothetical protein